MTDTKFETLVENLAGDRRTLKDAVRKASGTSDEFAEIDPDTMAAYLAGSLPEAERQDIVRRIARSPELREEVLRARDRLDTGQPAKTPKELMGKVLASPQPQPVELPRLSLWQRIEAVLPAPRLALATVTAGLAAILYVAYEPPLHFGAPEEEEVAAASPEGTETAFKPVPALPEGANLVPRSRRRGRADFACVGHVAGCIDHSDGSRYA